MVRNKWWDRNEEDGTLTPANSIREERSYLMKNLPKCHVIVALSPEQHRRVRLRCKREGGSMSSILPRVLSQWASEVPGEGETVLVRRAKPATYRK
jgi:hypothetical protein